MKKFLRLLIIAAIGCCVCISCEKDGPEGGTTIGSMEDLLGTYSVTVEENVFWGGDSGTIYDNGTITITKIDKNRVQLSGLISTQGTLVDGELGELDLESQYNKDNYGYITTTYNSALFGGGIITIWSESSGQLATTPNGTQYPYSSICYFKGRKVE